jgi:PBP1b-binding outer membrane lipoprotein LpoB
MKKTVLILTIVIGLSGFVISGCSHAPAESKSKQTEQKVLYQCPMDCEHGKTYDTPGKCPVCEMDLDIKAEI